MRPARSHIVAASAISSLVAVSASLLVLATREVVLRGVALRDMDFAFRHFAIVALIFIWPPLTAISFLVGIARAPGDELVNRKRRRRHGAIIGAAIGSAGLALFWLVMFGVSYAESSGWAVVGAGIGAICGLLFDRIAFGPALTPSP
jgi:hypothetical protein